MLVAASRAAAGLGWAYFLDDDLAQVSRLIQAQNEMSRRDL